MTEQRHPGLLLNIADRAEPSIERIADKHRQQAEDEPEACRVEVLGLDQRGEGRAARSEDLPKGLSSQGSVAAARSAEPP